jgi:MFS family permease
MSPGVTDGIIVRRDLMGIRVETQTNYRWLVLGVGVVAQMATSISFFPGIATIAPLLAVSYGMSLFQTGLLFSGMQLGPVLTMALWGVIADRRGDRFVLALGLGSGALVLATAGLIHSFVFLVSILTVASMLTASTNVTSVRAAAGWFAAHERGLALGIRQMSAPLGGATAALFLPSLSMRVGTGPTFVALAMLCGLAAIFASITLRGPWFPAARERKSDASVWRDRRLWRLAVGAGLLVLCQTSLLAYLVLFLTQYRHMSLQLAAIVFLVTQLGGSAARVVLGRFSDRIGSRIRPIRWIALAVAAAILVAAAGADMPLLFLVPTLVLATVLSMSSIGLAYTVTAEIAGLDQAGAAIGLEITLFATTGTLAPVAFGLLVTLSGWHGALGVIAVLAAAGWLVLRRLSVLENLGWTPKPASGLAFAGRVD